MVEAVFWLLAGAGAFWYFTRPKEKDPSLIRTIRATKRRVANLCYERCRNCGHFIDIHKEVGCRFERGVDQFCDCLRFQ
jgi:hypothetical protein